MKVYYIHSVSAHRGYEGELFVRASVDGEDVDIDHISFVDKVGNRADVTYLLTSWAGLGVYNMLCDIALKQLPPAQRNELLND